MFKVKLLKPSLIFSVLALIIALVFISQSVLAQTPPSGISLNVSPVFINLSIDPGKTVSSQFKVTNNNNFSEKLQFDVAKFESNPQTGQPIISDITVEDEFASWLEFDKKKVTLGPNETRTFKFTISPPKNAALGYYYAIVVNRQPLGEVDINQPQAAVAGAPAIPVLVEVLSPNAKKELQLVEFVTDKPFYEYLPTEFNIKVKNTGNVHVVPSGDIFIDSSAKQNIGIISANPGRNNILPNSERTLKNTWLDAFLYLSPELDKNNNTVYKLKYDLTKADRFRIGKYTAHLLMVYDNGSRDIPLEATVSFWVMPWKLLLIGLLIVYLAVMGLKGTISSWIKKLNSLLNARQK